MTITTPHTEEYEISYPSTLEAIGRINSLFSANGNKKESSHLHWQYLKSPGGSVTAFSVTQSGHDAAVYSVVQLRAKINGQLCRTAQSLDTLTDANHRGKGLFGKLAKGVYEQCDAQGVDIIFGFPNSSSGPVFFNKLGWNKLDNPPFLAYLNNLAYPINYYFGTNLLITNWFSIGVLKLKIKWNHRNNNYKVTSEIEFDSRYDDLWERFSKDLKTTVWRDSTYMEWRYKDKPIANYQYRSCFLDGRLVAIAIFRLAEKHKGNVGYMMELIHDPAEPNAAALLLKQCILDMAEQNVDLILAWSLKNHSPYPIYKNSGFLNLPRKVQPIKLNFGYRPSPISNISIKETSFFLSYSDSDTV